MRAMKTNNNSPPQISLKYCLKPFDDVIYTKWTILNYKYGLTKFDHSFSIWLFTILFHSLALSNSLSLPLPDSVRFFVSFCLSQYSINCVRHSFEENSRSYPPSPQPPPQWVLYFKWNIQSFWLSILGFCLTILIFHFEIMQHEYDFWKWFSVLPNEEIRWSVRDELAHISKHLQDALAKASHKIVCVPF